MNTYKLKLCGGPTNLSLFGCCWAGVGQYSSRTCAQVLVSTLSADLFFALHMYFVPRHPATFDMATKRDQERQRERETTFMSNIMLPNQ